MSRATNTNSSRSRKRNLSARAREGAVSELLQRQIQLGGSGPANAAVAVRDAQAGGKQEEEETQEEEHRVPPEKGLDGPFPSVATDNDLGLAVGFRATREDSVLRSRSVSPVPIRLTDPFVSWHDDTKEESDAFTASFLSSGAYTEQTATSRESGRDHWQIANGPPNPSGSRGGRNAHWPRPPIGDVLDPAQWTVATTPKVTAGASGTEEGSPKPTSKPHGQGGPMALRTLQGQDGPMALRTLQGQDGPMALRTLQGQDDHMALQGHVLTGAPDSSSTLLTVFSPQIKPQSMGLSIPLTPRQQTPPGTCLSLCTSLLPCRNIPNRVGALGRELVPSAQIQLYQAEAKRNREKFGVGRRESFEDCPWDIVGCPRDGPQWLAMHADYKRGFPAGAVLMEIASPSQPISANQAVNEYGHPLASRFLIPLSHKPSNSIGEVVTLYKNAAVDQSFGFLFDAIMVSTPHHQHNCKLVESIDGRVFIVATKDLPEETVLVCDFGREYWRPTGALPELSNIALSDKEIVEAEQEDVAGDEAAVSGAASSNDYGLLRRAIIRFLPIYRMMAMTLVVTAREFRPCWIYELLGTVWHPFQRVYGRKVVDPGLFMINMLALMQKWAGDASLLQKCGSPGPNLHTSAAETHWNKVFMEPSHALLVGAYYQTEAQRSTTFYALNRKVRERITQPLPLTGGVGKSIGVTSLTRSQTGHPTAVPMSMSIAFKGVVAAAPQRSWASANPIGVSAHHFQQHPAFAQTHSLTPPVYNTRWSHGPQFGGVGPLIGGGRATPMAMVSSQTSSKTPDMKFHYGVAADPTTPSTAFAGLHIGSATPSSTATAASSTATTPSVRGIDGGGGGPSAMNDEESTITVLSLPPPVYRPSSQPQQQQRQFSTVAPAPDFRSFAKSGMLT
jgi:hypothetical protein